MRDRIRMESMRFFLLFAFVEISSSNIVRSSKVVTFFVVVEIYIDDISSYCYSLYIQVRFLSLVVDHCLLANYVIS